jgi:hypothetical protein
MAPLDITFQVLYIGDIYVEEEGGRGRDRRCM